MEKEGSGCLAGNSTFSSSFLRVANWICICPGALMSTAEHFAMLPLLHEFQKITKWQTTFLGSPSPFVKMDWLYLRLYCICGIATIQSSFSSLCLPKSILWDTSSSNDESRDPSLLSIILVILHENLHMSGEHEHGVNTYGQYKGADVSRKFKC